MHCLLHSVDEEHRITMGILEKIKDIELEVGDELVDCTFANFTSFTACMYSYYFSLVFTDGQDPGNTVCQTHISLYTHYACILFHERHLSLSAGEAL